MKGYTIQHSIDLLEKAVENSGGGSGGGSTAAEVSYSNTSSGLVATNVQSAIDEIDASVDTLTGDVTTLKAGHTYSTSEQVVGKWIDNSLVYETTVHIAALPSVTEQFVDFPHSIANIDKIVGISGVLLFANGTVSPIPYVVAGLMSGQIGVTANTTNVSVMVGVDRSNVEAYVVLRYTKTPTVETTNTRSKKSK